MEKLESAPPKAVLCKNFGWNSPSCSWGENFKMLSVYFHYFVIISTWKRTGPFIWQNLNQHHPRTLCANFNCNWHCGSWEEHENGEILQIDGRTDGGQAIRKAYWSFSSGELKINDNPQPYPKGVILGEKSKICVFEPFWQEASVQSSILRWLLMPIGL